MNNLQQLSEGQMGAPMMPEQMAGAGVPGGPGTITGHMAAQEMAGMAPQRPIDAPDPDDPLAAPMPAQPQMDPQQMQQMQRMMYLQNMVTKLMGIATRDPKALRVLMEEEMQMNPHQIKGMYQLMLKQLETKRPVAKPSIAGLMEKRYGKARGAALTEFETQSPITTPTGEPGDVTVGWSRNETMPSVRRTRTNV